MPTGGEDVLWVPMDPPQFILTPLFLTDARYHLWRSANPYIEQLVDDMDYDEFSETRLMPSHIAEVCILSLSTSLPLFLYFCTW